jgi:hypothetical protein
MTNNGEPSGDGGPRINAGESRPRVRGRPFAKGNPGGPGRPRRQVEESYLAAVKEAVPTAKVAAILRALVTKAARGDVHAAQVVLKTVLGNETPAYREVMERLAALREQMRRYEERMRRVEGDIISHWLAEHPEVREAARGAGLLPEALPPPPAGRNGTPGEDGDGILE